MSQSARQTDSEGTLRHELAGTLSRSERALAAQLSELVAAASDPELVAQLRGQLLVIAALQDTVSTVRPATLPSLRGDIQAMTAATATLVQQARTVISAGNSAGPADLAATGAALRNEVASARANLFERRIFDSALTFATSEDETAYRQREAEVRRYIDQQLAGGTPEGELNAAGATMGHMLDAHAHGAGKSPEFLPQWNRLVDTTERHRAALRAEGRSTEEYDRNLNASIRRYLKDKGLSDAEIDAALAASLNPLEAVKPYLKSETDLKELNRSVKSGRAETLQLGTPITVAVVLPESGNHITAAAEASPDLADVMATFRAAGVTAGPQPESAVEPARPPTGARQVSAGLSVPR